MTIEQPTFKTLPRNNITGNFEVTIENPNDESLTEIWYTLDGSTPMDLTTHEISDTAIKYEGSFEITETQEINVQATFITGR